MDDLDELEESLSVLAELRDAIESLDTTMGTLQDVVGEMASSISDSMSQTSQGFESANKSSDDSASGIDKSCKKIKDAGHTAAQAITNFGTALGQLANAQMPTATQAMGALGRGIGDATAAIGQKLGGALDDVGDSLIKAGDAAGEDGAALKAAGEAFKVLGATVQATAEIMGATVGVMGQLMGIAIDVNEKIGLMSSRFAALAGSAAGGKAITDMVQRLSTQLPFATEQIAQWTSALQRAGLSGKGLEEATKAVAAAAALNPAGGAEAAQALIAKIAEGGAGATKALADIKKGGAKANKMLAEMGLSTHDLAAAMGMTDAQFAKAHLSAEQMNTAIVKALQQKGAGPLGEMMNSFPVILEKAKEGFLSLFDGLGPAIKPFMAAVKSLFGEFGKGGAATKALKPIITSVLSDAFRWATQAVTALRKVVQTITQNKGAMQGLKTALFVLSGAAQFVIGAFVKMIQVGAALFVFVSNIGTMVSHAVAALGGLGAGAADAASNLIAGLVSGIASGAGAVVAALTNLAGSALGAFKAALGIASPSKVMLEHGEDNIAGATAMGIDKGGAKVDAAMGGLVDPSKAKAKGGKGKGGGASSGSGLTVQFQNCTFGATTEAEFHDWMDSWWEKQSAAGPEPEPSS